MMKSLQAALALFLCSVGHAQNRQEPGHAVGTVTTLGNLIVLTLKEGALGKANMFDLGHRTLRFTPDGAGYRIENTALQWDQEFGDELKGSSVALHGFTFPYGGKGRDSFSVGVNGSISFSGGSGPGGVSIG